MNTELLELKLDIAIEVDGDSEKDCLAMCQDIQQKLKSQKSIAIASVEFSNTPHKERLDTPINKMILSYYGKATLTAESNKEAAKEIERIVQSIESDYCGLALVCASTRN